MNQPIWLAIIIWTLSWVSVLRTAPAEEWVDDTGKYRLTAELVDFDDENVRLKKTADGEVVSVPIGRLSEANRKYIESLGTPADYKAIKKLCEEIRRTWPTEPSVDTAWVGHFVLHFCDPVSGQPKALGWDEGALSASTIGETSPHPDTPRWQVHGPVAILRLGITRLRKENEWLPVEGLLVAVRRQGKWRVAAGVLGDWRLDPNDVYDAGNEDHRAIQALYDRFTRASVTKDLELLKGLLHPSYRMIMPGIQAPERPLVLDYPQMLQGSQTVWRDHPFRQFDVNVRRLRIIQGRLAFASIDVHIVLENGEEGRHIGSDILCRTPGGWSFAISPSGNWERVLTSNRDRRTSSETGPDEGS